jgi:hypothetical protein
MPGRAQGVTPEEPTAGILHGGVREGGDPGESWWTYTGTKLETADTAKEYLQLTGPPLLGMAMLGQLLASVYRISLTCLCGLE